LCCKIFNFFRRRKGAIATKIYAREIVFLSLPKPIVFGYRNLLVHVVFLIGEIRSEAADANVCHG